MNLLTITWDVTESIDLGFIKLHFYSLMFVFGFVLGYRIMKHIFKIENIKQEHLETLFTYTFIATLLGARLGHVFFYDWDYYQNHLIEILLPIRENPSTSLFGIKGWEFIGFRGLASHGATLALIISTYIFSSRVIHKPFVWLLDRICIPIALATGFIRMGNLINSEIVGKPTDMPWAFKFVNMSTDYGNPLVPRHPAQLYEATGYWLIFLLVSYLYFKTTKKQKQGYIFGLFFMLTFLVRLLVEFVKEPQGEETISYLGLNTGQILSIPFILIGFYFFITAKNKSNI